MCIFDTRIALISNVSRNDLVYFDFDDFDYNTAMMLAYINQPLSSSSFEEELSDLTGEEHVLLTWNQTQRYLFDSKVTFKSGFRQGVVPVWLIHLHICAPGGVTKGEDLPIDSLSVLLPPDRLRYHQFAIHSFHDNNSSGRKTMVAAVSADIMNLLCIERGCPFEQYVSQPCQGKSDRICTNLTVCRSCPTSGGSISNRSVCVDEIEDIAPTATTDRQCRVIFTNNATSTSTAPDDTSVDTLTGTV